MYLSWVFVILLLISLVNLGVCRHKLPQLDLQTYNNLQAITNIKVHQMAHLLDYRIADDIAQQLQNKDSRTSKIIKAQFESLIASYHYESIEPLNASGVVVLQSGESINNGNVTVTSVDQDLNIAVNTSYETKHGDFFIDSKHHLNLQILSPILINKGSRETMIAYVVIQTGFYQSILPTLQMWPTTSKTSDAVLIRNEQGNIMIVDATQNDFNGSGIHNQKSSDNGLYNLNKSY